MLTTGGGFMPYHHSEHFQMQGIRYLYPDPYFSINPELAEKLNIAYGDWCWIETRRGRIEDACQRESPRYIPTWCSRRAAGGSPSATARPTWTTRSAASSPTSTC